MCRFRNLVPPERWRLQPPLLLIRTLPPCLSYLATCLPLLLQSPILLPFSRTHDSSFFQYDQNTLIYFFSPIPLHRASLHFPKLQCHIFQKRFHYSYITPILSWHMPYLSQITHFHSMHSWLLYPIPCLGLWSKRSDLMVAEYCSLTIFLPQWIHYFLS